MTQKSGEKKATEGREEVPERWSAQRKMEVVLQLLRGEDLVEVSRENKVSPSVLEEWRRVFLEPGFWPQQIGPSTSGFVPANSPGWRVTLPGGTVVTPAEVCR